MSRGLENTEVVVRLSENVRHSIDVLHSAGILAPHIKAVAVEVSDFNNISFHVRWGKQDSEIETEKPRDFAFDGFVIKVFGGSSQSRAIATVVMGCVRTSLHMLEPDRNEVLW